MGVALLLAGAAWGQWPVSLEIIEALAQHVRSARLGGGLEGLVAGQGYELAVLDLPPSIPWCRAGRVLCARRVAARGQRRATLYALARLVLAQAGVRHTRRDARRLAAAIDAPETQDKTVYRNALTVS